MKAIGSLLGADSGPSEAQQKALALQNKQAEDLEKRRAEEERKKNSQLRVLRGLQGGGKGGSATLFADTGTAGLSPTLG